jgi:hypothetical protein
MKNVLITTATAALLLASQGAFAQPQNRGDGPGAGPQAPGPGASPGSGAGPGSSGPGHSGQAPGRAGPAADAPGPSRGNSANAPGRQGPADGPRAEQPQQRPTQKQAQPQQEKTQQKAEQKSEPKADKQRTGESKQQPTQPRADAKGKDADQNRTARDAATPKADGKADAKDTARKDADKGKDQNRNDTAQGKTDDKAHGDRMAGSQDLRQARERLDTQERVRLHDAFDRRGAKTNIRINVNIGTRVPRNVHLVRVPQTVVSFFPYYRDYSYFVVEERVYIVNPRSYEVVDVIDEGYGRGQPTQQHARLTLTDSQMVMVREAVTDADIRPESLRLRLALGAEIPRDVELHRFPARILDNVRELESYRFVLVEDQIVIVKPDDRSIALVIDRT